MKTKNINHTIIIGFIFFFSLIGCREDFDFATGGNVQGEIKNTSGHIVIISPSIGDVWKSGTNNLIRWSSTPGIKSVRIELFRKTELRETLAASIPNNNGLSWMIPGDILKSVHYAIKISNTENPEQFSFSDTFQIK